MDLTSCLEIACRSEPGMVRAGNEDSIMANPILGLAVLADGMGGHNAGEVASGMAVAALGNGLEHALANGSGHPAAVHRIIQEQIAGANTSIFQVARSQPQYAGMGTTLVMALFHDNKMTVAHIGDSRLYRCRGDDFRQITRDHSLLQEQIDSGAITAEEARYSQNKNLVTRALGVAPAVEPEIRDYDVEPGDVYLLCSDGLNDMVEDDEIAMTLQMLAANLELCATQLVQMANDNGGRDNVSVIVIKVKQAFPAPQGGLARLIAWFGKLLER
ncbi:Stp1/IreP family PP2C-type Ser/Thr phosphatase [Denitratisoma sp. DHT3]|uniref:Stp1/IreP family PP2C-type Ser/Thr phosphatase n=1 Tax=Denitratisoma sp. DHT3 TaxID=1981880 RepID=UPI0039658BF4